MGEHEHHHHHHSNHHHSSEGSSQHREERRRSEASSRSHRGSSSDSQKKHRRHHHHGSFSTTGGYRMAGPADTTPITIVGMEDTAKDDRLSLHVHDPNAGHSPDSIPSAHRVAHRRKVLRRKFRQNFLKALLVLIGVAALLLLLWFIISAVGKPKLPIDGDTVIGELNPEEYVTETVPTT